MLREQHQQQQKTFYPPPKEKQQNDYRPIRDEAQIDSFN